MSSDTVVETSEIASGGFSVAKELSQKDGKHLQVDLELDSTHDAEATVVLVEAVPAGTVPAQIGFMPDHEPHEWDLSDDGTLTLEARLVPEGTRQLIYGLRDIDPEDADVLTGEPRIAAVGGPAGQHVDIGPAEDGAAGDQDDAEADAAAADSAAAAGEEGGDGAPADGTDAGGSGDAADESGTVLDPPLDEDLAATLAAELEPHFEDGPDPVVETKLDQLQEDVGEMRTYLPALEDFLGDAGRADDIAEDLEDVQSNIDALEDSLDDLETTLEADIEESVDAIQDDLDVVRDRLDALEDWRGEIAQVSE